jgi:tetratricopeptide (TPR) repeat protein
MTGAPVHTAAYGLTPVEGGLQTAGPASTRMCRSGWPVRSGAVPPADEGLIIRPDTVPGLDAVLVPGAVVALVPGQDAAGRARDWPGSSGKTQLACYLAGSLLRSRSVDVLAWVAATSRAAVLSGYVQAAAELGLDHGGDAESVAARFLAWLAGTSRPWLVVLDDLRDAADLDGLWPAGSAGRLLITTADHATVPAGSGVLALPVPAFSTREALTYLSGRLTTDPDQRSGAIDLAGDLGCEPAALAQAAAVIISSGISCREYRGSFVQQQAAGGGSGDPPTSAWFTWTAAASHAERLAPGAGTWRLLALIALLDSHGIPVPVFTAPAVGRYLSGPAAAHQPDPQRARSALQVLDRVGLVTADATAVWAGRALQAAVRSVAPPELLDQAARAAADALAEVWPAGQPRSWLATALRACAVSLRQAAGDVLWSGGCHRLLLTAGYSLADAGLTGPTVAWWRELAGDSSRILGPDHPDTVAVGSLLADALLAAGDAAEAVTWSQWVLASRASVLGPDHPGTITAQVSLGRALVAGGKAGDAVRVLAEAAGHSERVRGPDDAGTLAVRDEYAAACVAAGQTAEAIGSCKRSLAVRERLHGPADPATLAASLRLAAAYLAAGKFKGAIGQYKRVLATREHALGPDHPDTLAARSSLAAAYDAAGQMGAALQEHQQACAGYEDVFGADHPETLARRADLARAYSAAGQLGDAVALLRDTIARSEQALSPGDRLTRTLRQALADITGEMTSQ